jgi:tocopherol O-methyltransferase
MIFSKLAHDSSDVARHYDDLDLIYRETWGEHLHHGLWESSSESSEDAVENLVNLVGKRLDIRFQSKVCDIGCGYAATSSLIAERFFSDVTGLTISEAQFKNAVSKKPKRGSVQIRLMNWLENDFSNASFDHAFSIESSEHMHDKEKFFSEAYRVLKPGGTFVVCAWLTRENPSSLEREYLLEPVCRHGRIPSLGSQAEYEAMLMEAGFQIKTFEDLSSRVSKTWSICAGRFTASLFKDPALFQVLFKKDNPQVGFFLSLFRIRMAYALRTMRYGLFTAIKPPSKV